MLKVNVTLIPQESFCCNLQSHTIIENAHLKLLIVVMATPARLFRCACLAAQADRLSNTGILLELSLRNTLAELRCNLFAVNRINDIAFVSLPANNINEPE